MSNRSDVINKLKVGAVALEFIKDDGTLRKMDATWFPDLMESTRALPDPSQPVRKQNDDVCRVYEIGKDQWRTFRWDSLETVDGVDYTDDV